MSQTALAAFLNHTEAKLHSRGSSSAAAGDNSNSSAPGHTRESSVRQRLARFRQHRRKDSLRFNWDEWNKGTANELASSSSAVAPSRSASVAVSSPQAATAVGSDANTILSNKMWDQPLLALDRAKDLQGSGSTLLGVLEQVRSIEERYANDLTKAVDGFPTAPSKYFNEGSSMSAAYRELVSMLRKRATAHQRTVKVLGDIIESDALRNIDNQLAEPAKQRRHQVKASQSQLESKESALHKAQKALASWESTEHEKTLRKHPESKNAADWRSFLSDKKQKARAKLTAQLREAEIAVALVRTVHGQTVQRALDSYQALDDQRAYALQATMLGVAEYYSRVSRVLWKHSLNSKAVVRSVDPSADMLHWTATRSNNARPPWQNSDSKQAPSAVAAVGSSPTPSTPRTAANPFSRASMLRQVKAVVATAGAGTSLVASVAGPTVSKAVQHAAAASAELQQQAEQDAAKFAKLQARKRLRLEKMKAQRHEEEEKRLREAQAAKAREAAEREERISQLRQEHAQAQEQKNELAARLPATSPQLSQARTLATQRGAQLQELLQAKEQAEKEKEELKKLLKQKEEEMKEQLARMKEQQTAYRPVAGALSRSSSLTTDIGLSTPVVIDLGSGYTKIGFAGQWTPALVVPSVLSYCEQCQATQMPQSADIVARSGPSWLLGASSNHKVNECSSCHYNTSVFGDKPSWDDAARMWSYLFEELGVNIQHHPVMVTQPLLAPSALQANLKRTLFEKFKVPMLYVATAPVLSAYAFGSASGLVIDLGHSSVQIAPVVDGYVMEAYVERAKYLGGAHDTTRLLHVLRSASSGKSKDDAEDVALADRAHSHVRANAIKEMLSLCMPSAADYDNMCDVLDTVQGFVGAPDADPEAAGDDAGVEDVDLTQTLPLEVQSELLKCAEVLFQPKNVLCDDEDSLKSVPSLVAEVVERCGPDNRRTLLENVFLCGGMSDMPGLAERLERELKYTLPYASAYLRVHASEGRYASWVGGSVLGSLADFQEKWMFEDDWREELASRPADDSE